MSWLNDLISAFTPKANTDISAVKQKIMAAMHDDTIKIDNTELLAYVNDIDFRLKNMVNELKKVYKTFNIDFNGFKSFSSACEYLKTAIKNNSEEAYNNIIKLESTITSEQQRHLALIRMAVTKDGKRVMEQITSEPAKKEIFNSVFGEKSATGKLTTDGLYQRLWSEIHRLSEYILIQKNRIYH